MFFNVTLLLLSLASVGRTIEPSLPQQPLQAASDEEAFFDSSFDTWVEEALKIYHVPGLSLAVIDRGKIVSKVSLSPILSHFILHYCQDPM